MLLLLILQAAGWVALCVPVCSPLIAPCRLVILGVPIHIVSVWRNMVGSSIPLQALNLNVVVSFTRSIDTMSQYLCLSFNF